MSKERWATYSVKDHLQPRELAIDMLLFDRLVFPVPETGSLAPTSGASTDQTFEVAWSPNPDEQEKWRAAGWDPEAQSELLTLIAPVVRKVAWRSDGPMDDRYRDEAAKLAAEGIPDWAFVATRTLLTQDLPAYVDGVAALGPAYRSFDAFAAETGGASPASAVLPGRSIANLIAGEFVVPDVGDTSIPTRNLLAETADFAAHDEQFRNRRAAFAAWCDDFTKNGLTDPESARRAAEAMADLLSDANAAARRLAVRTTTRFTFQIAPALLGVAAAAVGSDISFAVGGVFLSLGAFAVEERLFPRSGDGASQVVAFVHDARRQLGWKTR